MIRPTLPFVNRRSLLKAGLAATAAGLCRAVSAETPPPLPRATSGDRIEPLWSDRLTISVGRGKADIVGADHRAVQAAVDYVAGLGGGTVRLLPGEYRMRNAVYLRSKVRLVGAGDATVLVKEPSTTTKLVADSDWYDQEITLALPLADDRGFRVGDGVCLLAKNPHNGSRTVVKRTLVARNGNRFKLDRALRENLWLAGDASVATLFPILSGENVADIAIENLTLDGNRANNDNLDGNYAGCVFLQDCNAVAMRNLTARNYNGDGISWQICHDVVVENCRSHGHAGLGLHPGSGSQRTVMRGNTLSHNAIGIFFCWGVRSGVAEGNVIEDNSQLGISVGHRDTDNLIRNNTIRRSGQAGILFRPEPGPGYAPHRNRVEGNRIENSGADAGAAIDVQGPCEGLALTGNTLVETRGPARRVGIRIAKEVRGIALAGNRFEGFSQQVQDLRK